LISGACLANSVWGIAQNDGIWRALRSTNSGLGYWTLGSFVLAVLCCLFRLLAPIDWVTLDYADHGQYGEGGALDDITVRDPEDPSGRSKTVSTPVGRKMKLVFLVVLALILVATHLPSWIGSVLRNWSLGEAVAWGGMAIVVVYLIWDGLYKAWRINRGG